MTRLHIHISVNDLAQSTKFYSALFGADPTTQKQDYAKWMLDDPCVNFAISARGATKPGLDHLGIQAEDETEMATLRARFKHADMQIFDEGKTTCCYAESDKTWVQDPSHIARETYHTMAEVDFFHGKAENLTENLYDAPVAQNACCVPEAKPEANSCC